METNLLLLKTLFCCSACDGEIATEEVNLVKTLAENDHRFAGMDIETLLNGFIDGINATGKIYLKNYINELTETALSDDEQIAILDLAIKMIEADNQILYSEVKFFKKIRKHLSISDDAIIKALPLCEDYLLPDINAEDKDFEEVGNFAKIHF